MTGLAEAPGQGSGHPQTGAAAGILAGMGSQLLRFVLRFGYQVALARMLAPEDFGLVAMTLPAIGLLQLFADLGLTMAVVQRQGISPGQLSTVFWASLAVGAALAALGAAAAPLVAWYFGEPRVAGVMAASSGIMFLGTLHALPVALLTQRMRFRALAVQETTSLLAGMACGLGAALLGAGCWAILANQTAMALAMLVMAWPSCGWRPGRPAPWRDVAPLLSFGTDILGFRLVKFVSRNLDSLLIGRFAGAGPLGLYDRAFRLMLLPFEQATAPFSRVAFPLLSRCLDQPEAYRAAYGRLLQTLLLLVYPALAFMIACRSDLVALALGPAWAEVAPLFAILGIDAFVAPVGASLGWLLLSQGRARDMRNCAALTSLVFVACVTAGLFQAGVLGVAMGYVAAGLIELLILCRVATRRGPVGAALLLGLLFPFLLALPGAFAGVLALRALLPASPAVLPLLALAAYASFAAGLACFPQGRRVLREAAARVPLPPRRSHGVRPLSAGATAPRP